jgi:pimeloyl-ACP methyl ester carboxylesterase
MKFEVFDIAPDAMGGKAVRKQVKITLPGKGGEAGIRLLLFLPKDAAKPAPCLLFICNRGLDNIDPTREKKSPFWPAEEIVARGYAAATFHNADVAPDKPNAWTQGVHTLYDPSQRAPDAWGTIAAWAWGASRCMDYLVTDPAIDARRVAVVGHSRGGKTALWAGAEDPRFAMVVSNCSGSTGASIARGKQGENIRRINTVFPHWFCENYKRFNDREAELPVDQHLLAALAAPRLLYIASATGDPGADPRNEFRAGLHATPVYRLLGLRGLAATEMPAPDSPSHEGEIGYHIRTGKHDLTVYDWNCFMDFADRHLPHSSPGQP